MAIAQMGTNLKRHKIYIDKYGKKHEGSIYDYQNPTSNLAGHREPKGVGEEEKANTEAYKK